MQCPTRLGKLLAHPTPLFQERGTRSIRGFPSWHWAVLAWRMGWCRQNEAILSSLFIRALFSPTVLLKFLGWFPELSPELFLSMDSYPLIFVRRERLGSLIAPSWWPPGLCFLKYNMLLCLPSSDHFMMWWDQALEGTSFDFSVPLPWLDFLLEVGQITYLHWFLGVFYKIDIIPNRKVLKQVNSWGFFLFKF